MLALERIVLERDATHGPVMLKFFLGSAATTSANLAKFIASGGTFVNCGGTVIATGIDGAADIGAADIGAVDGGASATFTITGAGCVVIAPDSSLNVKNSRVPRLTSRAGHSNRLTTID